MQPAAARGVRLRDDKGRAAVDRVQQLPQALLSYKVAKLQSYKVTKSQSHKVTKLQSCGVQVQVQRLAQARLSREVAARDEDEDLERLVDLLLGRVRVAVVVAVEDTHAGQPLLEQLLDRAHLLTRSL